MTTRVLVAMDDSELAERALRFALENHPNTDITVLHVVGTPTGMLGDAMSLAMSEDIGDDANERAEMVHERAHDIAAEYDTEIETSVEMGHPARAIVSEAEDFDIVVLGSHSGSLTDRLFVGNVAQTVFRRCPVPVTTVR